MRDFFFFRGGDLERDLDVDPDGDPEDDSDDDFDLDLDLSRLRLDLCLVGTGDGDVVGDLWRDLRLCLDFVLCLNRRRDKNCRKRLCKEGILIP